MQRIENRITDSTILDRFSSYFEGDCVVSAQEFLAENCIDLIITDPPYGIEGDTLHKHYNRDESFVIDGYVEIPDEKYEEFTLNWLKEAERVLQPGGSLYLISGWTQLHHILNAKSQTRFTLVNHIIWKYNFGVFTRAKYTTSHYHILYLVKPGERPTFNTYCRYSPKQKTNDNRSVLYADMEDVWVIPREYKNGKVRHKNELPFQLLQKIMQYSSNEGDLVADFFAGSFSTAKVAKGLNRNFIGFEISKEACEYQKQEVEKIQWGEMLDQVPQGKDERPTKQYQAWSDEEIELLLKQYEDYRTRGLTKRNAIDRLCDDLDRGYFAVLNALKKNGL